jgi:alpha-glucosidase/alpha-D-xyloside xylohydrolase
VGPQEYNNTNSPIPPGDRRNILASEMNNPAIEPIARRYSELRYQLLPYTYSLAWQARSNGLPLMRAMWLHYATDTTARSLGDQYLWGRDLLIAPVYEKGAASRSVYLPSGVWYDWWTGERLPGGGRVRREVDLATMPIYARAGAIIPVDPVRQYALQPVTGPTILRVYRGADGEFTLYEDDGVSQEYLSGRGSWTRVAWSDAGSQLTIESAPPAGASNVVRAREFRIEMFPAGASTTVRFDGRRVVVPLARAGPLP